MVNEFNVFNIVWDVVSGFSYIILTVNLLHSASGVFPDTKRAENRCPVLFRTHVEELALKVCDNLQVFDQIVAFVLCMELCLLPSFRDVIHFS